MNHRTCPFCGHQDNGGIRAVLNEIRDKRLYVARCHCPKCERLQNRSDEDEFGRMLAQMTSLSDWQRAAYTIDDYEAHMARYGKEAGE